MSSWAPVSNGSNRQFRHKEVDFLFGSDSIGILTEAIHTFDSRPRIFELERNAILSEAKKQLSRNYWHQVQHSECVGVTTATVCMGHNHDLYDYNKHPDALERYMEDVIYPVVRYQESMVNNPVAGITRKKNQCWWQLTEEQLFTHMAF